MTSTGWYFKPVEEEQKHRINPISEAKLPFLTDSLYLQNIKQKLKELNDKIIYYEVYHPHHKDIQKMKLIRKKITNEIFRKNNKDGIFRFTQ